MREKHGRGALWAAGERRGGLGRWGREEADRARGRREKKRDGRWTWGAVERGEEKQVGGKDPCKMHTLSHPAYPMRITGTTTITSLKGHNTAG